MWVLLLVVTGVLEVNGPPVVSITKIGDLFKTESACNLELNRITVAMKQSYPGDTDYYLECKPVVRRGVSL